MKDIGIRCMIVWLFFTLNSYANIDAQIKAIQNASVNEKFKLMNAFKKSLIKMKEKERIEAVKKLSIKTQNRRAKKVLKELTEHSHRAKIKKYREQNQLTQEAINTINSSETGDHND